MQTAEETIAAFIVGQCADEIPGEVYAVAAEACLDCIGVAVAGSVEAPARAIIDFIAACGGAGAASIVATARRATPADAALANGVAAHALDYDDMGAFGHPSAVLLPATLALAEGRGASGRDLLDAYVVGFEVGAALEHGLGISQGVTGLHGTAMIGIFATTAAACRLLGLDHQQTLMAMGVAASLPAGLVQNFGTHTKSLHAGMAARNGVMAALLAAGGWTANPSAFEGAGGMLAVYGRADTRRLREEVATLGGSWRLTEALTLKRFPCCGSTHAAINAIGELRQDAGVTAEAIEWIEIAELPPASHVLLYPEPRTGFEGKFSIQYAGARAFCDERVAVESFCDAAVADPRYLAVKDKVRVRVGAKWAHGGEAFWPATTVTMRLRDGRTLAQTVDRYAMPGTRAQPLSPAAVRAKFEENCARGGIEPGPAYAAWSRLAELSEVCAAVATVTRESA